MKTFFVNMLAACAIFSNMTEQASNLFLEVLIWHDTNFPKLNYMLF